MTLQILWFILWGTLWAVYFMLDGFDFGAGMLRNFLARDETERSMTLSAIGPIWNGNEVWLITAGGATFAAFPLTYASMFSFLYLPMLLILFSLIIRGVSIEFRAKSEGGRWHSGWDWALAVTSLTAPLVLGLGFGNIFQGLPIAVDGYKGSFWMLFNGYGLLTAVLFIVLFLQHGALWLEYRTEDELSARSRGLASALWFVVLGVAVVFLVATAFATKLYGNYLAHPIWILVPLLAVAALVAVKLLHAGGKSLGAFAASCATIVLVVATALVGLFPNLIPSSLDAAASLTAFNSSSGPYTLKVMTIVACIFVPIVIVYQFLVYRFFRTKLTKAGMAEEGGHY
ncbi:MAG TPA: cytochrome d ubiquinol oxidase subunit II [Rectinemataceae bacterium]|nr:cytochrome d ubiquinol oxidase subunit II [Rectinemataceae bacterium]